MIGLFGEPDHRGHTPPNGRPTRRAPGAADAEALFALLRPNDLIWNYWVNNNLLGEDPPAFDVWPGTRPHPAAGRPPRRLPGHVLAQHPGHRRRYPSSGPPSTWARWSATPSWWRARNDHLTAWKACYATTQLLGGHSQFALSSSGHIQSLVNPPGNPKMSVAIGPTTGPDPDEWLARTEPSQRIVVGAVGRVGGGSLR